jgi:hypothetical protein
MNQEHSTGRSSSDRTETVVFSGLMGVFMAGSPLVAYAAGRWADARLSRAAQLQRSALRQVPATLLRAAPPRRTSRARPGPGTLAQWRAPDGQLRTGPVVAPSGTAAGSTVRVWVNQAGDLAGPPIRQSAVANRVELVQGLAAGGFAVALAALGGLARQNLDKRRLAA